MGGFQLISLRRWAFDRQLSVGTGAAGRRRGVAWHGQGNVMCVDDVITAGTAIRESKQIIDACGASLAGVLVCLDRQERGQTGTRCLPIRSFCTWLKSLACKRHAQFVPAGIAIH